MTEASTGQLASLALDVTFDDIERCRRVRQITERFIEVHLSTPLAVCEIRDPKGLYRRAREGSLTGLTGIDDPYEEPRDPELRIDSSTVSVEDAADRVISVLTEALEG